MKKRKQKEKSNFQIIKEALFFVFVTFTLFSSTGIITYHFHQDFFSRTLDNLLDKAVVKYFNAKIDTSKNETWYQEIIDDCKQYKSIQEKSYCVRNRILPDFKYVEHPEDDWSIYSPSQTIKSGGVCRDWTQVYSELFKMMNVKTTKVLLEGEVNNHVFLIVYNPDDIGEYCLIDQTNVLC